MNKVVFLMLALLTQSVVSYASEAAKNPTVGRVYINNHYDSPKCTLSGVFIFRNPYSMHVSNGEKYFEQSVHESENVKPLLPKKVLSSTVPTELRQKLEKMHENAHAKAAALKISDRTWSSWHIDANDNATLGEVLHSKSE